MFFSLAWRTRPFLQLLTCLWDLLGEVTDLDRFKPLLNPVGPTPCRLTRDVSDCSEECLLLFDS